jgi:hypothetical protein
LVIPVVPGRVLDQELPAAASSAFAADVDDFLAAAG